MPSFATRAHQVAAHLGRFAASPWLLLQAASARLVVGGGDAASVAVMIGGKKGWLSELRRRRLWSLELEPVCWASDVAHFVA